MRVLFFAATLTLAVTSNAESQELKGGPGDAARGEQAYQTTCLRCHGPSQRIRSRIPGDTAAEKARWLDAFLGRHYAEDDKLRADLIAFLAQ
ncbi:hypothetical protein [Dichotomicrobium thermohalophilum]|uniref:Cytochrome c domain-containing protein n=1 Tax=Dichotomicrobium thermohalophilum TaxID=933063 RepID=A0A397Q491_9HYPH|nr:hypothetical protein [Dichotomicrobium thermohalophilum]RIA55952.1 hypothetical protein BXY53_1039 [Dichotomicrobium thermohalophilum]